MGSPQLGPEYIMGNEVPPNLQSDLFVPMQRYLNNLISFSLIRLFTVLILVVSILQFNGIDGSIIPYCIMVSLFRIN